ncbi:MAG: helix-turn-helix domain-containing protein [Nanoarchaeota archaeon]|nr:helix-turn-helix domain-containing protein [Nanoarchaeota archaeon]
MENIKDFLASIGLGKNETEVYSALVDMGTSSVLDISKKTKIHRSNIYDALRDLLQRGLIFETNNPTKLFTSRPPQSLVNYLKQKEAELDSIVKDYESKQFRGKDQTKIKITKGNFALREAIFSLMESGQPISVYGIPKEAPDIIGPLLKDFHKERMKRKIPMQQIYNSGAVDRVKYLNKLKFTEAKILPQKYDSFATTNISGNKIVILLWENEITVIEVVDEFMAKPYRNYFDILWRKAQKVV